MESSVPVPKIRPSGWNWAQVRAESQILITTNETKAYHKYVIHIWEMYLQEKEKQILNNKTAAHSQPLFPF